MWTKNVLRLGIWLKDPFGLFLQKYLQLENLSPVSVCLHDCQWSGSTLKYIFKFLKHLTMDFFWKTNQVVLKLNEKKMTPMQSFSQHIYYWLRKQESEEQQTLYWVSAISFYTNFPIHWQRFHKSQTNPDSKEFFSCLSKTLPSRKHLQFLRASCIATVSSMMSFVQLFQL